MPYAFIIAGIVLLTAGVRGTSADLMKLLKGDLTGENNFVYWILAILLIGALGYVQDLRVLSRSFLVLVILVLLLQEGKGANGGFFSKIQQDVRTITESTA